MSSDNSGGLPISSNQISESHEESLKKKSDICPSKSTVYLGNISFSLTNNDLVKLVEHCGRVVCAKIVKDQTTRKSKGYAFVQFLHVEGAEKCVKEFDRATLFGRTWSCSIAKDNGRSQEFIRKRTYPDKTRCYECGEFGHLSYKCSKNALGDREPPIKKNRKRGKKSSKRFTSGNPSGSCNTDYQDDNVTYSSEDSDDTESERDWEESLSAAIESQRELVEEEEYRRSVASGNYETPSASNSNSGGGAVTMQKRKFVKDDYFSDEENLVDD